MGEIFFERAPVINRFSVGTGKEEGKKIGVKKKWKGKKGTHISRHEV